MPVRVKTRRERELNTAATGRASRRRGGSIFAGTALSIAAALAAAPAALANPAGGVVSAGSATISSPAPAQLDVTQTTNRAVIDWRSFDIATGEKTVFQQPSAASVALNRIHAANPSTIAGQLSANGSLVLINPNGVVFAKGAQVDVNSIIVTPTDISNANFMAGRMRFDRPSPNPDARVVNDGTITVAQKGLAALVAPNVVNSGAIEARLGRVVLAGAATYTVDFYGDGLINFAVGPQIAKAPLGPDGKPVATLVANSGTIAAPGGTVLLTADAAAGILANVVASSGRIDAPTTPQGPGKVILDAGAGNGAELSGTIDVAGSAPGQTGGTAIVTGGSVALAGTARIDASGPAGGGSVAIGGGPHGAATDIRDAQTTTVAAGATIDAGATDAGNGGTVSVWANGDTVFDGTIAAKGGPHGGNGGWVETSGKADLTIGPGAAVSTLAVAGTTGTWLLDPADITISAAATANGAFDGLSPTDTFTAGAAQNSANLRNTDLQTALANNNVVVSTSGCGACAGPLNGTITVSAPVTWSSANSLTLLADNNIVVGAAITGANAALILSAGNTTAAGSITISDTISVNALTATAGTAGKINLNVDSGTANVAQTAGGGQTYNSPVVLQANAKAVDGGSGTIAFNGTVNAATNQALEADAAAVTFGAAVGLLTAPQTLTVSGATTLTGDVKTVTLQDYKSAVTLAGDLVLTSTGGAVQFEGALGGAHTLTVSAATNAVFSGAVGNPDPLTTLDVTATGGEVRIGNDITTSGTQTYHSPVRMTGTATLATTNANVTFDSTIDSLTGAESLTVSAGTGTVTFTGPTGGTNPLASLSASGVIALGGNIKTSGTLALMDMAALTVPVSLTSTGGQVYLQSAAAGGVTIGATGAVSVASGQLASVQADAFVNNGTAGGAGATFEIAPNTPGAMTIGAGGLLPSAAGITASLVRAGAVSVPGAGLTTTATSLTIAPGGFDFGNRSADLRSTGAINGTAGGIINVATLTGDGASADLSGANTIAQLGGFTTTAGDFILHNGKALAQTATTVDAGAGTILIDNGGNNFDQSAGTLKTTNATPAAITIENTGTLTVGTLTADAANGGVSLGVAGKPVGTVSQPGPGIITAGSLTGVSGSSVTLDQANQIATLDAFTAVGNFILHNNAVLTQQAATTVDATAGTILIDNGGQDFDQSAGTLTTTNATAAAITIQNTGTLKVGTLTADAANGGVALGVTGKPVGTVTEPGPGIITAGLLTGVSGSSVTLDQANQIATLDAFTAAGNFSLHNSKALAQTATTVDAGAGTILIDNGGQDFDQSLGTLRTTNATAAAITIENTGTLTVGTLTANSGTVVLGASGKPIAGAITEAAAGAIQAANLVATTQNDAGAAITLDSAANAVSGNVTLSVLTAAGAAAASGAAGSITLIDGSGFTIASAGTPQFGIVTSTAATAVLQGGGAISETGSIQTQNLVVRTLRSGGAAITLGSTANAVAGNVTLSALNTAGTAADAGAITFADNSGFTVAAPPGNGLNGQEKGIVNKGKPIVLAAIPAGAPFINTGAIDTTGGTPAAGDDIAILADAMTLAGGTLNAGTSGRVVLGPYNGTRAITLVGAGAKVAGSLSLDNSDLATITAPQLQVGANGTGYSDASITLTGTVVSPSATLALISAGTISETDPTTDAISQGVNPALALAVEAGGDVVLKGANQVATLAGSAAGTAPGSAGDFDFVGTAGGLTIGAVPIAPISLASINLTGGVPAIANAAPGQFGGISAAAAAALQNSGDIDVARPITAAGILAIESTAAGGALTIDPTGNVSGVAASGTAVSLFADKMSLNGTVTGSTPGHSGDGVVLMAPHTATETVTLLSSGAAKPAGTLALTADDINNVHAARLQVGYPDPSGTLLDATGHVLAGAFQGAIFVNGNLNGGASATPITPGTLALITAGAPAGTQITAASSVNAIIESGADEITVGSLGLWGGGTISLPGPNRVSGQFAGRVEGPGEITPTATNSFWFSDDQTALTIGAVSGLVGKTGVAPALVGVVTNNGNIVLETTTSGDLLIDQQVNANNGSTVLGTSPGQIGLSAAGTITQQAAGVVVGSALEALAGGSVELNLAANRIGANDQPQNGAGAAQSPGLVAGNAGTAAGSVGTSFALRDDRASMQVDGVPVTANAMTLAAPQPGVSTDTDNGNIILETTGSGSLAIDQPVNAGAGSIALGSAGTISQGPNGIITTTATGAGEGLEIVAAQRVSLGAFVGPTDQSTKNRVTRLAAVVAGSGESFVLRSDNQGLTVASVEVKDTLGDELTGHGGLLSGVTTNNGNIGLRVTTAGDLAIDAAINAGSGTLGLEAAGSVTGGPTVAAALQVTAGQSVGTATQAFPGTVALLSGRALGGTFNYVNGTSLTVGSVGPILEQGTGAPNVQMLAAGAVSGVVAGQDVRLTTNSGGLTVTGGDISATGGDAILTADGGISLNGPAAVTAGHDILATSKAGESIDGPVTLTAGHNAILAANGPFLLRSGTLTVNAPGDFVVSTTGESASDLNGSLQGPADPAQIFKIIPGSASYNITFDGTLNAQNSVVLLLANNGAISVSPAGGIFVKDLGLTGSVAGSAVLYGAIRGNATKAAAELGQIIPTANNNYQFNNCAIGSTTCIVLPPFVPVQPQQISQFDLLVARPAQQDDLDAPLIDIFDAERLCEELLRTGSKLAKEVCR
jgi:filamentous hemagglutinin family protein